MKWHRWQSNPQLKVTLDSQWDEPARVIGSDLCWRLLSLTVDSAVYLGIDWQGGPHAGALSSGSMSRLRAALSEVLATQNFQALWLRMASSGADLHDPFASLIEINSFIETLDQQKRLHDLTIIGEVLSPQGTYGGASLILATICDELYMTDPSDWHLLGAV